MGEVSGSWFIDEEDLTTRRPRGHLTVTQRFDLTDSQCATLEPLLAKAKRSGRPSVWSRRRLIDAIRWRIRVGAPWRDVPAQTGHGRRRTRCFGGGSGTAPGSES